MRYAAQLITIGLLLEYELQAFASYPKFSARMIDRGSVESAALKN